MTRDADTFGRHAAGGLVRAYDSAARARVRAEHRGDVRGFVAACVLARFTGYMLARSLGVSA